MELPDTKATPLHLKELTQAIARGILSSTTAKQVLVEILESGHSVAEIIERKGLAQICDEASLRATIERVLADNPDQLAQLRQGRTKLKQYFLGQIMKATAGKANPRLVNKLLEEFLAG